MSWSILESHPLWFQTTLIVLLLFDLFLIYKHFKNRKEDIWELVSRIVGSNFFGFYLIYKIVLKFYDWLFSPRSLPWHSWLQWILIIIPFAIFFWSYLFRKPAIQVANRFREILFPFFCALLPFGVYESSSLIYGGWIAKTPNLRHFLKPFYPGGFEYYDIASFLFILMGDLIAVWGLLYLRSSFSIMAEVREWVKLGPYHYIRHPMYLGEILATIGFCLLRFSYFNLFLTLLFVFCISLRAKFEEEKMKKVYPEYQDYQIKRGFLFPKF